MIRPRKPLPLADTKMLYGKAAGRCAFAVCRRELVMDATAADSPKQIGEIAHIVAHSDDGPRGDSNSPRDQLNTYENSILLCPTCHARVDAQIHTYTVTKLQQIKMEHENWVRSSLTAEMPNVGFPELDVVAKIIASPPETPTEDFSVIAPREKMCRNNLTGQVDHLVLIGLTRSREVSNYLQNFSVFDMDFAERLKAGFLAAYNDFRDEGLANDALFEAMHDFASGGSRDFRRQAAGLAILVYLFESCEVFEK